MKRNPRKDGEPGSPAAAKRAGKSYYITRDGWRRALSFDDWRDDKNAARAYGLYRFYLLHGPSSQAAAEEAKLAQMGFNYWGVGEWPAAWRVYEAACAKKGCASEWARPVNANPRRNPTSGRPDNWRALSAELHAAGQRMRGVAPYSGPVPGARSIIYDRVVLLFDTPDGTESWTVAEGQSGPEFVRTHPGYTLTAQAQDPMRGNVRPVTFYVRNDTEARRRLAQEAAERAARKAARAAARSNPRKVTSLLDVMPWAYRERMIYGKGFAASDNIQPWEAETIVEQLRAAGVVAKIAYAAVPARGLRSYAVVIYLPKKGAS
jgi:hypothetical protein